MPGVFQRTVHHLVGIPGRPNHESILAFQKLVKHSDYTGPAGKSNRRAQQLISSFHRQDKPNKTGEQGKGSPFPQNGVIYPIFSIPSILSLRKAKNSHGQSKHTARLYHNGFPSRRSKFHFHLIVSFSIHKVSLTLVPLGKIRYFLCFILTCCNTPLTRRARDGHFFCGR